MEDPNRISSPQLYDTAMKALATRFQESDVTKLPAAFDNYFLKGHRKTREPSNEYLVRHNQSRIKFFALTKVQLPPTVDGWLLLRRAGLNSVETSMVMSQLQGDLANDRVSQVLEQTFGQRSLPSAAKSDAKATFAICDTSHEQFWQMDSEYEDEDDEYYEDRVFEIEDDNSDDDRSCDYEELENCEGEELARQDFVPSPRETFSVEYYDQVLATYNDAHRQLNDMRLSRGFYPIVALVPTVPNKNSKKGGSRRSKGSQRVIPPRGKGKKEFSRTQVCSCEKKLS